MQSVPPDSLVYYEETQLKIVSKRRAAEMTGDAAEYVHSYEI